MAKVRVRVLYPIAFEAQGTDTEGKDVVEVDGALAAWAVAGGFAELVEPEPEVEKRGPGRPRKTETAVVKLEADA